MLDRTLAPESQPIDKVLLKKAETHHLKNGTPVHIINAGSQPVVRIELIYKAGSLFESQNAVAYFTAKMLSEGTEKRTAKDVEDYIAQYGAFLDFNAGFERTNISLYALSKHLPKLVPILSEIASQPLLGEKELENLKSINLQNLKVNLEKTSYVASQQFKATLFGENHPYGKYLTEETILKVNQEQIREHHTKYYKNGSFDIVVSGNVNTSEIIHLLNDNFGSLINDDQGKDYNTDYTYSPSAKLFERKDSLQSSIRFGRPSIPMNHPDYFKLNLLVEILGGYFGSRLMKNIREDKGYTYGIHASLALLKKGAYLVIGTDVKKEVTQNTLDEIIKEIDILRNNLVEEEELETVKSYLLGNFLNSINTPFSIADKFKTIYFNNLTYDFYDDYVKSLKSITSEEIKATAQQYLDIASFSEVVVGGK